MNQPNVQSSRGVTLVGRGGPTHENVQIAMSFAPDLVAADGGANFCFRHGFWPKAVIGDFDSLESGTRDALDRTEFIHVREQDSTDFEKCLTLIDAPFVLATGFAARRLDHTLANMSVLARRPGAPTVVLGEHDIVFAAPSSIRLDLPLKMRVSLFPMTRTTGRSEGLQWPIDGLVLEPAGQVGTSNRVTGPVTLEFDPPGCLVLTPPEALGPVLQALVGSNVVPER